MFQLRHFSRDYLPWVTEVQNFLYISSWDFYSQSTISLFETGKYLKGRSSARFWDHLSVIPFYSGLCCLERYVRKMFQLIKYLLLKYFSQFLKHYFLFVLWENIAATRETPIFILNVSNVITHFLLNLSFVCLVLMIHQCMVVSTAFTSYCKCHQVEKQLKQQSIFHSFSYVLP